MKSDETCGNCGTPTENEPLVLCDECNAPAPEIDALRIANEQRDRLRADLAQARAQVEALTKEAEEERGRVAAETFDAAWAGAFVSIRAALDRAFAPDRERLTLEVSALWMRLNAEIDRAELAALKPSAAKETT